MGDREVERWIDREIRTGGQRVKRKGERQRDKVKRARQSKGQMKGEKETKVEIE